MPLTAGRSGPVAVFVPAGPASRLSRLQDQRSPPGAPAGK